jgi:predicted 3-demethylubiquinone-9 3-methyltransferase (glyoxalase superfamily)
MERMLITMFKGAGSPGADRAMDAMLKMKKIDMAALRRARDAA